MFIKKNFISCVQDNNSEFIRPQENHIKEAVNKLDYFNQKLCESQQTLDKCYTQLKLNQLVINNLSNLYVLLQKPTNQPCNSITSKIK